MEMQLFLIWKGHFSWTDVNTMPVNELIWFYHKLVEFIKKQNSPNAEELNLE